MAEMPVPRRSAAPWVVVGISVPLFVLTIVLTALNGSFQDAFIFVAIVMIVGYTGVGAVLASREPGNRIGWIMITMGLGFLLTGFTDEYLTYAFVTAPGSLPLISLAAWLTNWSFILTFGPALLLLALFPTGQVPSPRWRFLPVITSAAIVVIAVCGMFAPGEIDHEMVHVENPIGIDALGPVIDLVSWIALLVFDPGRPGLGRGARAPVPAVPR